MAFSSAFFEIFGSLMMNHGSESFATSAWSVTVNECVFENAFGWWIFHIFTAVSGTCFIELIPPEQSSATRWIIKCLLRSTTMSRCLQPGFGNFLSYMCSNFWARKTRICFVSPVDPMMPLCGSISQSWKWAYLRLTPLKEIWCCL